MSLKISVIIPIYKVEKYIDECIQSVINQTYKDLEIILVDDGSPDNCPTICDNYAKRDSRITVIHKENGGLSDARNYGIDRATGDYIIFVDSDDYWENLDMMQKVADKIEETNSDVVLFGFKCFYENSGEMVSYFSNGEKVAHIAQPSIYEIINNGLYVSSSWVKVVKRELFIKNNLTFVKGVSSEDVEWSARLMLVAKTFSYINEEFYIYRQREFSVTSLLTKQSAYDLEVNLVNCLKLGEEIKNPDMHTAYMNYVAFQYITLLKILCVCNEDVKKEIKKLKQYRYLLKYNWHHKVKKVQICSNLLGFNLMMKLLKIYLNVRK